MSLPVPCVRGVRPSAGFTLIELVIVVVLMGIMGTFATRFITHSVQGYMDTAQRQQLANRALIGAEKISRALRTALPASVRTATGCIEFIPVLAASHYVSVPITVAADRFQAVAAGLASTVTGRVAVYPSVTADLYNPGNDSAITSSNASIPQGNGEITVSLGNQHQFPTDSPSRRFYLVSTPTAFCQQGDLVYRYRNYGFNSVASLPPASAQKDILMNRLEPDSLGFTFQPTSLTRSAVVHFNFELVEGDTDYRIEQEVNLRNVP